MQRCLKVLVCCSYRWRAHLVLCADLVENIRKGNFPEWDFMWQTMDPAEQENFDFDPLDCTKVCLAAAWSAMQTALPCSSPAASYKAPARCCPVPALCQHVLLL